MTTAKGIKNNKQTIQYPYSIMKSFTPNFKIFGPTLVFAQKSALLLIMLLFLIGINKSSGQAQSLREDQMQELVKQTLKKNAETIRFMENKGQVANSDVLYYFEGKKGSVYIERNRIRFVAIDDSVYTSQPVAGTSKKASLFDKKRVVNGTHTFSIYMDGANIQPTLQLGASFRTKYNFFVGENSSEWASDVRAAKDLTLKDVYPGIDLRLYSTSDGELEFDWVMDAGADYSLLKLRFEGQDDLTIDQKGNLEVGLHLQMSNLIFRNLTRSLIRANSPLISLFQS